MFDRLPDEVEAFLEKQRQQRADEDRAKRDQELRAAREARKAAEEAAAEKALKPVDWGGMSDSGFRAAVAKRYGVMGA